MPAAPEPNDDTYETLGVPTNDIYQSLRVSDPENTTQHGGFKKYFFGAVATCAGLLILAGIIVLFIHYTAQAAVIPDSAVQLQQGTCPQSWYSFSGRCYKYVASRLSWADAEKNCVSENANLVSIHSREENDFVRLLINSFDVHQVVTWVGLTDLYKEGWWAWTDGSKVSHTEWQRGELNNNHRDGQHCGVTNCGTDWCCGKEWCDTECYKTFASVCEARPTCS